MKLTIYSYAKMKNPSHRKPYTLGQFEILDRIIKDFYNNGYHIKGISKNNDNDIILDIDTVSTTISSCNLKPENFDIKETKSDTCLDYLIDEGDTIPGDHKPIDTNCEKETSWEDIKKIGSKHYKAGKIEPIDLFRDIQPNQNLTALDIKALTDAIKYAYRMLVNGSNKSDCGKIIHYMKMVEYYAKEDEPKRK
jgi:hypothetical protein